MRIAARVIIIIGLVLGSFTLLSRVYIFFAADGLIQTMDQYADRIPQTTNIDLAKAALEQASERSFANIGSLCLLAAMTIAGGVLGLLASASDAKKKTALVLAFITTGAGVVLLIVRTWVCGGAYVLAGVFLLLALTSNEKKEASPEAPPAEKPPEG